VWYFTKAFAIVAAQFAELRRRISLSLAPPVRSPYSVASVAIERDYQGRKPSFLATVRSRAQGLDALQEHLRRLKEEPLHNFGLFRRP